MSRMIYLLAWITDYTAAMLSSDMTQQIKVEVKISISFQ